MNDNRQGFVHVLNCYKERTKTTYQQFEKINLQEQNIKHV